MTRAHGTIRRILRPLWRVLRAALLLGVTLILAVLLSLDLPVVRRFAIQRVDALLLTTFAGKVTIERLDHLALTGISGLRVRVEDPDGLGVLLVDHASVRLSALSIAASALWGKGDLRIDIADVSIDYVDANLDVDGAGNLRLAKAFEPKEPKKESLPSSRGTLIHIGRVAAEHAWLHGRPEGAPLVDADVDHVELSALIGPKEMVADVTRIDLATRALPQGADLRVRAKAHFAAPSRTGSDREANFQLEGTVGGIPVSAHGSLDGQEIAAVVDVPKATAEAIRALVPGAPIETAMRAHAEAHGRLPEIDASARFSVGAGTVELEGHVIASEETRVRATLSAKGLDARALSATAPASDLGANATIDIESRPHGKLEGRYAFDVLPGTIGNNAVPPAHVHGEIHAATGEADGDDTMSVTGSGRIEEPGAPTSLDFHLRQRGASETIDFEVDTTVARLERTRLGPGFRGEGTLRSRGTVGLGKTTSVDADVDVTAAHVTHADQRVQKAWLRAHARGPSSNPMLDVIVQGNDVAAGGMQFATTVVTVHGAMRAPEVTLAVRPIDGPMIEGRATVVIGDQTTIRDARVELSRDDVHAAIDAGAVRIGRGEFRADGIVVRGLGDTMRAEARKTSHDLFIRASTNELDLARLSRLLGLRDVHEGHVGLDVDLAMNRAGARGYVRVDLVQAVLTRVRNGNAHLQATFEGRRMNATAHAELGQLGRLDMDPCLIEVGGDGPLDLSAWRHARADIAFDSQFDISRLRALLPRHSVPFDEMQGTLHIRGAIAGDAGGTDNPELRLSAQTKGLLLSGRGERERVDGTRVIDSPPWRLEGVDVELTTSVDRQTGATALATRLFDRRGTLVSLDAKSPAVPYEHWLHEKILSPESLQTIRLTGQLVVPRRELKSLPSFLNAGEMNGDLAAQVDVDGTALDPTVHISVETKGFASRLSPMGEPIDARVDGLYERSRGTIDVEVGSAKGQLLGGTVRIEGRVADWLRHPDGGEAPWQASTEVRLTNFPLETLTLLSDFQVKGRASGELAIEDLHRDGRANVNVELRDLELGRAKFPRGYVRGAFDGTLLHAAMRLDQKDGFVEAEGQVGMTWGSQVTPSAMEAQPAFARLKASRLQAGAILPFSTGILSALAGRIDADARLDVGAGWGTPKMEGTIALTDGRVQLTRVGEPFHGVTAKLAFLPDGVVRLTDATAQGSTGMVMMSGVARLNGFRFVGARAAIRIPTRDPLPVDIDGDDIGDVEGQIDIRADMAADQRALKVDIDIPRLHTVLPLSSTHKVQELGEAESIRVGHFRRSRQFVLLPKNADDLDSKKPPSAESAGMEMNIAIHLGDDVEIKRGTTLRILLDGNPTVRITDKARVSGQIRLRRGNLEVQGKRFDIEKGTVSFVGDDPSNPQIVVTAGWTAPDGTRIYADFVGPLKSGRVSLRAEPSRSQNEILALIMFGTAEGSSATPYPTPQPDGASRAGAFAGSFATEGLSRGLDELTGLEISAKIDTTNAANPRPELEMQIARDISLQIGYVIGTPPPGTNPDKTLVTLDWRFRSNWSMAATFGDQGSSIMDLIWQYRY